MYKAITNLEKLCRRLIGAAKSHGRLVADSLVGTIRSRFSGEGYPNVLELHGIVAEELEVLRRQAMEAERNLMASLTADQRGRAVRNRWFKALREQLIGLRKILEGLYGPGTADIVFMKLNSFVHVDPAALYRQALLVHDNLLDPAFLLPDARFDIGADLQRLAREMAPNIEGLGLVLDELELQGTVQSLAAKEASLAKAVQRAGVSARLLEALAAYAQQPGIASRIRLSSHTSSASASEEGAAAEAEPAPEGEVAAATGEDASAAAAAPADPGVASPPAESPTTTEADG